MKVCCVYATGIYSCTYLESTHDMLLQCRITNYDSVGGGGNSGGDVNDYDGCNGCGGDAIIIFVGLLAAAVAYAMQQPTAIRNKTSTHALDINRIVKSMAVIA